MSNDTCQSRDYMMIRACNDDRHRKTMDFGIDRPVAGKNIFTIFWDHGSKSKEDLGSGITILIKKFGITSKKKYTMSRPSYTERLWKLIYDIIKRNHLKEVMSLGVSRVDLLSIQKYSCTCHSRDRRQHSLDMRIGKYNSDHNNQ